MRIGIIGPTGAGKTLLSKKLAATYKATLIEVPAEKNEFLPYFYQDKETFAMLSQNAFYSSLFLNLWKTRDNKNLICDSTLFDNLVYTETLRICGIMSASETALTFAVAEEHLTRVPQEDLYIVLVRTPEELLANVLKNGRPMEKKEKEFFEFQFGVYYDVVERIFKNYKVPETKILRLNVKDINDPEEYQKIVSRIDAAYKNLL